MSTSIAAGIDDLPSSITFYFCDPYSVMIRYKTSHEFLPAGFNGTISICHASSPRPNFNALPTLSMSESSCHVVEICHVQNDLQIVKMIMYVIEFDKKRLPHTSNS